MILNSRACEALRRTFRAGDPLPVSLDDFDQFTLSGLLDALATAIALPPHNPLVHFFESHFEYTPVALCWQTWNERTDTSASDLHGKRPLEFYRLRVSDDQVNEQHQLFRERFVRSLKAAGFAEEFSYALAGAFGEMTDNVIQHSRSDCDVGEFTGLAGYHVESNFMSFGVIDVGQGVLASLKRSPKWNHLDTPARALREAVCANASSRIDQPVGEGFRTIFRSLTDRNAILRFRSDDASLMLGDGGQHRQGIEMSSAQLAGLQLSVCCATAGIAEERPIKIS